MNTHITNIQMFKIQRMSEKNEKIGNALADFYRHMNRLNRINKEIETIAQSELSIEIKDIAIAQLLGIKI